MDTLDRTLAMLRLIPRYPRRIDTVSLRSFLEGMGYTTSLRTIQRDLNHLSERFPLESDESKPQGWWWSKEAGVIDIPGLDPQTAMVFKMVEEHLRPLLPVSTLTVLKPWFETASKVLQNSGMSVTHWPNKVRVIPKGMPLLPPKIDPEIQSTVYSALFEARQLRVAYRSKGGVQPREHYLHPLAVVQRGALIYLIAATDRHDQPFQMLLHRMTAAQLIDAPVKPLPGFNLDDYIAAGGLNYVIGPPIDLVLRLAPTAVSAVTDTPLSEDQVIAECDDGWIEVRATVPNTVELRAWIRGFGDEAILVSPALLGSTFHTSHSSRSATALNGSSNR